MSSEPAALPRAPAPPAGRTEGRTAGTRRLLHLLTPGDHYSPGTGSAVPTVVHGLSAATAADAPRPGVLVAAGTYTDRYQSADAIEYAVPRPRRWDRYTDVALGRALAVRPGARRTVRPALAGQTGWEPSVVLAHNLPQALPLVDARRHAPVLYAHNQLLRTYTRREADRVLGPAAAVVAVSDHLASGLAALLPPSVRPRLVVVRNGVDAAAFAAPARADDGVLSVVYVGRTIPDKGVHVLVDAVRRLARPDVRLEVVGGAGFAPDAPLTPYERSLRRVAAPAGDRISFRPFVARAGVPAVLAGADVAVVPSCWPDPCPLTVLEGMASGAALVGTTVGGIPELVRDAGVLVPPDDSDALADALAALADDAALLRRLQSAARERAVARDWRVVHDELDSALARVVP